METANERQLEHDYPLGEGRLPPLMTKRTEWLNQAGLRYFTADRKGLDSQGTNESTSPRNRESV